MSQGNDTIAAIATPPGRGGVGVLRVSGPGVRALAVALLGELTAPRRAVLRDFRDAEGQILDTGLVLFFPAPHSFTGEDVLELHGHGGRVVMDLLLKRALELGSRLARPGEFSERAFLNDKLDLAQAEAIADLIDSGTAQAARAALRSLRGDFSARVTELVEALVSLRMYVEAAIDFPEEEVDFLREGNVGRRLAGIADGFERLRGAARQGSLMQAGVRVVIIGRPNAGKSSLFNYLVGHEAAIVTEIPGTTRDLLHESISLDGLPVHLTDTAGLRESGDVVEREGVARARREIEQADQLLLVVEAAQGLGAEERHLLAEFAATRAVTLIYNKIDLVGVAAGASEEAGRRRIDLSAKTGAGVELLRQELKRVAGFESVGEDGFMARRRHLDALARAGSHLEAAAVHVDDQAGELLAEELRLAQRALGEITGEFSSDDLLGRIFTDFCIGK